MRRAQSSARCFLHERADSCLFGGGQLFQREGDGPRGAFVEVRLVAKAQRRVPGLELLRALEEADDVAVLGICGHPVPEFRREGWRAGFDDRMEPLAHGAIRFRHLGDLREHSVFAIRLVRARALARGRLQLLGALLHRGSFLVRESLERLVARGGALGASGIFSHLSFLFVRCLYRAGLFGEAGWACGLNGLPSITIFAETTCKWLYSHLPPSFTI